MASVGMRCVEHTQNGQRQCSDGALVMVSVPSMKTDVSCRGNGSVSVIWNIEEIRRPCCFAVVRNCTWTHIYFDKAVAEFGMDFRALDMGVIRAYFMFLWKHGCTGHREDKIIEIPNKWSRLCLARYINSI